MLLVDGTQLLELPDSPLADLVLEGLCDGGLFIVLLERLDVF